MSSNRISIWLDDERPEPRGWHRVYTERECIALLDRILWQGKHPQDIELSLDHDLGDGDGTGYGVLAWLEEQVARNGMEPPELIHVHTANPVGRERMHACIASIWRIVNERNEAARAAARPGEA